MTIEQARRAIESSVAIIKLEREVLRLSAENADAQAKEAFALGKLEETLKIEGELRSENKRLEALDKERVSTELAPDTCPECHGTGKTVINKLFGVEDCPECSRDSTEQTPSTTNMTIMCGKCKKEIWPFLECQNCSQDGINDRGSDEYANPERDGDRQ